MHVAMVLDAERLLHERSMLNRLCIALIGEGVQVTRVVPQEVGDEAHEDEAVALAGRATYPTQVAWWGRGERVRKLAERFGKSPPDVLVVVGIRAWQLTCELGKHLQRPVVIEAWSWQAAKRLAPRLAPEQGMMVICPTEPLAKLARRRLRSSPVEVEVVRWGVPYPDVPTPALSRHEDVITLAVLGPARQDRWHRSFIPALSRWVREMPQALVTYELDGRCAHKVWRLLRGEKLLDRVAGITRAGAHRSLLTQCDALIVPEPTWEVRSIVIEAMAAGVPIIAREDQALDFLLPDETATVLSLPTSDSWLESLRRLGTQTDTVKEIAMRAREQARVRHRVSQQAEQITRLLERVINGGSLPFDASS